MNGNILLARQPILDRTSRLRGYELLARDLSGQFPKEQAAHVTTGQVLVQSLTEFGLDALVGDLPAFVNLTREFLVGEVPLPLPPDRVVLEVLETIAPDAEVLAGMRRLKEQGFTLAADDYVGLATGYAAILELVDLVKVDCLGRDVADVERFVRELAPFRVRMLAEKVERHEEFRAYDKLGFELFQGYYFARPDTVSARSDAVDHGNLMRLLAELQNPETTAESLERIIARDAGLSLRLVRMLNSARFGLHRRIESLREVIVYLGRDTVRNIASLLLLTRVDTKPRHLMFTAMMRARMCEELARVEPGSSPQRAFTVGLFSTLDAVVDRDLREILSSLPLHDEIRNALLDHGGELGRQLDTVLAFERGDLHRLTSRTVRPADVQRAFLRAADWARHADDELAAPSQGS
jgi:EAL and modified HD-GYP domain-containing signal transduction protein